MSGCPQQIGHNKAARIEEDDNGKNGESNEPMPESIETRMVKNVVIQHEEYGGSTERYQPDSRELIILGHKLVAIPSLQVVEQILSVQIVLVEDRKELHIVIILFQS